MLRPAIWSVVSAATCVPVSFANALVEIEPTASVAIRAKLVAVMTLNWAVDKLAIAEGVRAAICVVPRAWKPTTPKAVMSSAASSAFTWSAVRALSCWAFNSLTCELVSALICAVVISSMTAAAIAGTCVALSCATCAVVSWPICADVNAPMLVMLMDRTSAVSMPANCSPLRLVN